MKCLKMVANKYGWSPVTREEHETCTNLKKARPSGRGLINKWGLCFRNSMLVSKIDKKDCVLATGKNEQIVTF